MKWIHNNWRVAKKPALMQAVVPVKRTDVLWRTRQDEVWKEIASLLELPLADSHTPNWFAYRMVAMKNIIQRMTPAKLAELDREVAQLAREGYSEEDKHM